MSLSFALGRLLHISPRAHSPRQDYQEEPKSGSWREIPQKTPVLSAP